MAPAGGVAKLADARDLKSCTKPPVGTRHTNVFILGDVAKLAYAQDLKSCDLNGRVGSIPTIPTTLNPLDMGLLSSSHRRPAFTGLTLV